MWAIFIAAILFIVGAWGVILPGLPGVPLAWLGLFIYAYHFQFQKISLATSMVFLGLTLLTIVLDIVLPIVGLKKFKPTRFGVVGAVIGLLIGLFTGGPVGIIIGPFIGALLGELLAGTELRRALTVSGGTVVGFLASAFLKLVLIAIMFGFFIFSFF